MPLSNPASGSGVTVQDEGTPLSTAGTTLNFVGAGVAATGTGATKTITISGTSGVVASDTIWDAAGDLVQGTGADTAAKLTLGAAGTVVRSTGSTNAYAYPPGYEFDYAEVTSNVFISTTSAATATAVVTGNAVTYDGSTIVLIHFFSPWAKTGTTAGNYLDFHLYDGSTQLGEIGYMENPGTGTLNIPVALSVRITPSAAAHTYSIRCNRGGANGTVFAGNGAANNDVAAYIRITKA